jgi:hypothetical protein
MSWRNQETHREETKAVKDALLKAGFANVKVEHGRGTAWGWLEIHCDAKPSHPYQDKKAEVLRIAKAVTGRHGDYDGEILIF